MLYFDTKNENIKNDIVNFTENTVYEYDDNGEICV